MLYGKKYTLTLLPRVSVYRSLLLPSQTLPIGGLGATHCSSVEGLQAQTLGKGISTGGGGHLVIVGTFEEGRVVGVHLERGLGGDGGGAAPTHPGVRVEELAGIVGAVAETWVIEALVWPVHLLRCVALHKQVDGHDAGSLSEEEGDGSKSKGPAVFVAEVSLVGLGPV